MRLLFKGDYIEGPYPAGSICRFPDGYRVRTYQGTWEDTVAPVDLALFRDGRDGRDGVDGIDGRNGVDGKDGRNGVDGKDGKRGKRGEDGLNGGRGPRGPAGSGIEPVTAVFDSPAQRGDVVYVSGPGHVDLAQANADPPARAIGLANGDGTYMVAGPFNNDAWNLSPGAMYFLDPSTPGGMTTTCPTGNGQYVIIIGVATTPTQLNVQIHYSMVLEA
jgi:hypothetical protein